MFLKRINFFNCQKRLSNKFHSLLGNNIKYNKINNLQKMFSSKYIKDEKSTNVDFAEGKDENIMNPQYDYTKHSLLKHLYMFGYNKDNIGYVIHEPKENILIGIDFGEYDKSNKIVSKLEADFNCKLKYIFTTHSHNDHSGGNDRWKKVRKNDIKIYSGDDKDDVVSFAEVFLKDLETVQIGEICIACMHTPGHTKSAVCYVITHVNETSTKTPFAFTGDTLFVGGCGRVFNGTHEELYNSLKTICYLPNDTLIFCGHEYTEKNLEFCLKVDPENEFLKDKMKWVKDMRSKGEFTMGSRLVEEKLYNPFLRASEEYYITLTNSKSELESFKYLRTLKDNF